MIQYKLLDFGIKGDSCTGQFIVKVNGDKAFEAAFTSPVSDDGATFMKLAGKAFAKRYLPPSKFEGDLRQAVGEEFVYEILDPTKDPTLLVDDESESSDPPQEQ